MVQSKLDFASLKNRPREVAQKATSDTANISSDEMFGLDLDHCLENACVRLRPVGELT